MTALDILILCLVVIDSGVTLGFVIHILNEADGGNIRNRNNFLISPMKEYFVNLFYNKNLFGIILNILIVIFLIPGIIICLVIELILWIMLLVMTIYELGNKTE